MKKKFNTWTNYFLIGIACLHVILFFIPIDIKPGEFKMMAVTSGKRDTNFVISPSGTLVGWGFNDYRLVANGNLYYYPYFARKTILKDVVDIDIGSHCAMAVDKNGTLWGWGSYPSLQSKKRPLLNRPVKVMEDILAVELDIFNVVVIKTDGSLWTWSSIRGDEGYKGPTMIMQNVKSIYSDSENFFAIQDNNDLYAFTFSFGDIVRDPTLIASGIKDITVGPQNTYQFLTTEGEVFLYHIEPFYYDEPTGYSNNYFEVVKISQDAAVDNVQTLCHRGLIKYDDSYWRWEQDETREPVLIKQNENVAYVGVTYGETVITITRNGKMYAEPMFDNLPIIPQSMRTVSPTLRNLFLIVAFIKIIMNKYYFKNKLIE